MYLCFIRYIYVNVEFLEQKNRNNLKNTKTKTAEQMALMIEDFSNRFLCLKKKNQNRKPSQLAKLTGYRVEYNDKNLNKSLSIEKQ